MAGKVIRAGLVLATMAAMCLPLITVLVLY